MTDHPSPPANGRNGRWVNLGEASVDSAQLAVCDPGYLRHGVNEPPVFGPEGVPEPQFGGPYNNGTGVSFWAGFGNGGYDVWAWVVDYGEGDRVDERVAEVRIVMIDDAELAQWRRDA